MWIGTARADGCATTTAGLENSNTVMKGVLVRTTWLRFVGAVAALVFLIGCSSQPDPENAAPEIDLVPQSTDDQFVMVAKVFPGFAGLYYGDDGGLVLNVASPPGSARAAFKVTDTLEDEVLNDVLALLGDELLKLGYSSRKMVEKVMLSKAKLKDLVEVRRVDYDYISLKTWYDNAVNILGSDTVISSDIDERANRIVYGIEELDRVPDVQKKLTALSIPLGAVTFKQETAPEPLVTDTSPTLHAQATINDYQQVLRGGLAFAPFFKNCTMGFNAVRNGVHGFVTNSHCTYYPGSVTSGEGGRAWQPEEGMDQHIIGQEVADPAYRELPGCPNSKCRLSDSAFYRYTTSRDKPLGAIANVALNGHTIISKPHSNYFQRERSRQGTYVGLEIHKVGANTGYRRGKITQVCSNALSQDSSGGYILCEVVHDAPTGPGDSGSPIYVRWLEMYYCGDNKCIRTNHDLLGIHWRRGGGTSPIWDIEAELGALTTYYN